MRIRGLLATAFHARPTRSAPPHTHTHHAHPTPRARLAWSLASLSTAPVAEAVTTRAFRDLSYRHFAACRAVPTAL